MLIENVILPVIIALGLLNVWIIRSSKLTQFRGGQSQTLKQEFKSYGLSDQAYYLVGFLKIVSALALIASIWIPMLRLYAASVVVFLMIGALLMHIKIKDPVKKSVPALAMLAMSASLLIIPFV